MRASKVKKFFVMLNTRLIVLAAFIFACSAVCAGQFQPAALGPNSPKIFPVAEVREGMRGTARSVFRGTKSEEFNVEILGVLPNWIGPKQDLIVGKLSGANAERTFVFAGMSGSPVYIDGKLVGAISYSFPFAKEPICGITPFEQMAALVEPAPPGPRATMSEPRTFSLAELLADTWTPSLTGPSAVGRPLASGFGADSRLMAVAGQTIAPIATPITFSGVSQKVLDLLAPEFIKAGLLPVAAAGGSTDARTMKKADENTLLAGDSVVVHLARGDVQIAAAGTVTVRDGNKIHAFGHPFFGLGSANLPMSESHVVTVVPNANNSFKLAVADSLVGTMTQDRATGIYGLLGQEPRMIPVRMKLTTSRGRSEEIYFESAIDELLTPLIINAGVSSAMTANERGLGDSTIDVKGEIVIKGQQPIKLERRFAGLGSGAALGTVASVPVSALLRANFDGLEITGINLNVTATDGSRSGVVDRMTADKTQVRAGETVEVTAYARSESGRMLVQTIPVAIPKDTAPGQISIVVGDGVSVQQNSAITQFTPRSAAELIATINRLKRPDRLYLVVTRTTNGTVIGTSELPNLPPSMMATLNNDRSAGGSKATVQTIIGEMELPLLDHLIIGSQTLALEVVR